MALGIVIGQRRRHLVLVRDATCVKCAAELPVERARVVGTGGYRTERASLKSSDRDSIQSPDPSCETAVRPDNLRRPIRA